MRSAVPNLMLASLMLATLALAACGSVRKPDLRLPNAYEAPQPQPGAAAQVVLDRWWTAFNDPQLTALIDEALEANPDARSALARLREARASRASALAQFLPQGDLTASAKRTHSNQVAGTVIDIPGFSTSGTSEAYAANLNVSWEMDVFRLLSAHQITGSEVEAARFDYQATRASLAAQTADAYFQVRGLAIQLADARESARIQRELYDLVMRQARAGLAPTADADRVAGELAQAEAQAVFLEAELQVERRTLLILAGRVVEPTASIEATPMVGVAPPVPASLPSQLLARRPDVRRAQAQLSSALGQRNLDRLALFPTFNLIPGIGWSKQKQPGFSAETDTWTLGASAMQPVLSIPRLLADLEAQGARAEQAVATYEKTLQTAFGEAEGSLVRLDADRRRVATLTEGEARAARAYRAARIGYGRGLTDLQTALSAEQSWRAIRAQLTSAQVDSVRQAVTAYKALGGGWPADQAAR